jgi:hypothetical protein
MNKTLREILIRELQRKNTIVANRPGRCDYCQEPFQGGDTFYFAGDRRTCGTCLGNYINEAQRELETLQH